MEAQQQPGRFVLFMRVASVEFQHELGGEVVSLEAVDVGVPLDDAWAGSWHPTAHLSLVVRNAETLGVLKRGRLVSVALNPIEAKEVTLTPGTVAAAPATPRLGT